jgi:hemolysin activation/secretion protein
MSISIYHRLLLGSLGAATAIGVADAQAAPQIGVPDAGKLLQQVQPPTPPAVPQTAPSLRVAPEPTSGPATSAAFDLRLIRITGNTVFDEAGLHALVASGEGQRLTLAELEALAGRITAYYQNHGYPLSRAIIPAQSIRDGVVVIQVVEARYGAVRIHNGSRVSGKLLSSTLASLKPGAPIAAGTLDRTLLLASDIPGVTVDATLQPGATVGTSDLDATVTRRRSPLFYVLADNSGNRYTGRARVGGGLSLINPLGFGDVLAVNGLTTGDRLQYGRASYDLLLNGIGTHAGVVISALGYKLGRDVRQLDAHGSAQIASAWVKQPLLRSKFANISAGIEFDYKRLRDRVDVVDSRNDRHLNNWVFSLSGDVRDGFLGGGITVWGLGWTRGNTRFDDPTAAALDAASAKTSGTFFKVNLNASRVQYVTPRTSLYVSGAAQWADANLDTAEKVAIGGPDSVRAYDIGVLSADRAYLETIELRRDFGSRWHAKLFVDAAQVKFNHQPWVIGNNTADLAGGGAGLAWDGPGGFRLESTVAARFQREDEIAIRQAAVRGWVSANKAF